MPFYKGQPAWNKGKSSWSKGKHFSQEHRYKISQSRQNEGNGMWKGDSVGLSGLHAWVRVRLLKPKKCFECKDKPPMDLANVSGQYKRDLSDWEWLCRSCHMKKDGRLMRMQETLSRYREKFALFIQSEKA